MIRFIFFLLFSSCIVASAQRRDVEINSLEHLANLVYTKIDKYDVHTDTRQPETFIMFFEIDSFGYVTAIHLMSDEKARDSSYYAAARVQPSDLRDWKGAKYGSKVVIMPVNTFGTVENAALAEAKRNYLRRGPYYPLLESANWKTANGSLYIMGPNIVYQWRHDGRLD